MAVVGNDNGDNGHAGLDSKVKSSLLEGQQHGILSVAPRALGEHVHALPLGADLIRGAAHGLPGVLAVLAVDEDAPAQGHEPAQKGDLLERPLGRDAAVLGEHGAQHEDVELGLVVADEDGRARGAQDVLGVLDVEDDARGPAHGEVESSRGGPLGDLLVAEEREDDGGEDAVESAYNETHVGGEDAGGEGSLGDDEGDGVHGCGQEGVPYEYVEDIAIREHCGRADLPHENGLVVR